MSVDIDRVRAAYDEIGGVELVDFREWPSRAADALVTMIENVPDMLSELQELRPKVADCPTCNGNGVMQVLVNVLSPNEREEYEDALCGECGGTGIGHIGRIEAELAAARKRIAEMEADCAAFCGDNERMVKATNCETTEAAIRRIGLLCSWDDLWRSACVVCGSEPGCNIDCPLCEWYAKNQAAQEVGR